MIGSLGEGKNSYLHGEPGAVSTHSAHSIASFHPVVTMLGWQA